MWSPCVLCGAVSEAAHIKKWTFLYLALFHGMRIFYKELRGYRENKRNLISNVYFSRYIITTSYYLTQLCFVLLVIVMFF